MIGAPSDVAPAAGQRGGRFVLGSGPSELTRSGAVTTRLLDAASLERLQREALVCHDGAVETRVDLPRDGRSGDPDRWLESAPGGRELDDFYGSDDVVALLHQLTGLRWQRSGPSGSFSYYRRPGHHLGLHRDIDICELAAITCLIDEVAGDPGLGGMLLLYPGRSSEALTAIRRSPDVGAVRVRLRAGETLLLLGGLVPHRLLPLGAGHLRVITPLCYRVAPD